MKRLASAAAAIATTIVVAMAQSKSSLPVEQGGYKDSKYKYLPAITAHELSAYAIGGYSALRYAGSAGAAGYGLGAAYGVHLSSHWSLRLGLEAAFVGAAYSADALHGEFAATAPSDDGSIDLLFNSDYTNYHERQNAAYLNVPLLMQWHTDAYSKRLDIYAGAGIKIGIGIGGSYHISADRLLTSCSIPMLWATLTDNASHNLADVAGVASDGRLSFGMNAAIACEAGLRWTLAGSVYLYTGVFLDYGLLNVLPHASGALVAAPLERRAAFAYNSILAATTPANRYTDKANLLMAGLRLAAAWECK